MKALFSIHALLLLLATALLAACSDDKEEPKVITPSITWAEDQESPTFAADGGTEAVLFSSATSWEAEVDQSWCSVEPAKGSAGEDCEVRITAEPNGTDGERKATLTLRAGTGTVIEQLTIVQVQKDAIVVAQSEYTMKAEGGTLDFVINTNVEFTVSFSADWIRQNADTRVLEEVPVSFIVDANPDGEPREAVITFASAKVEQTVTVRQEPYLTRTKRRTHTNRKELIPLPSVHKGRRTLPCRTWSV